MALLILKKTRCEEWGSNRCLDYLAERGGLVRRLSQAKILLEGRLKDKQQYAAVTAQEIQSRIFQFGFQPGISSPE